MRRLNFIQELMETEVQTPGNEVVHYKTIRSHPAQLLLE